MGINVCPAAVVAAPVESVWEIFSDTTLYEEWWEAHMERIAPEGKVVPRQYLNPISPQPIPSAGIPAYVGSWLSAFPDLSLRPETLTTTDGIQAAVQWQLTGQNSGGFSNFPPSGQPVNIHRASFFRLRGDQVQSVQMYFDVRIFYDQMGLQALVLPKNMGPVHFDIAVHVSFGRHTRPGAFTINKFELQTPKERKEILDYSNLIFRELAEVPGFISLVIANDGNRSFLITAWEKPGDSIVLLREGKHHEAIAHFMQADFKGAEMNSTWVPTSLYWRVQCPNCGRKVKIEQDGEVTCACGAVISSVPEYW